jgi:hypothetical protein
VPVELPVEGKLSLLSQSQYSSMWPLDGLEVQEYVTLKHLVRPSLLLHSMPYKPIQYQVITVQSALRGTDKHPIYIYCQYISLVVAHDHKYCTCWNYQCTEIVSYQ